ncbi:hypothetical protein [Kerstersia similis]|uniref:hypothetical protein n=1 Tax=Kerstersia similis TaxID=206505 RepID=UPI0039EE124F
MLTYKSTVRQGAAFLQRAERQVPYATSVALNKTAWSIRLKLEQEILRVFDRPTPYTQRSLRVTRATKARLQAAVGFAQYAGKGIRADQYLWAQVYGGNRAQKRSERALERVGLPGGYTVPGAGAEMDAYGNMSRGQLVRLMSYLEAFGEQGYRANSTAKSRARLAKAKTVGGYKRINGVVYFVSRGKGSMSGNREQNLAAGVWRKTGTHGADVKPVLLATRRVPSYRERLPFFETADQIHGERFDIEFSTALEQALATAK